MKIFLLGFMGCGKTTIGKKLAHRMNYLFIDTDRMIENHNNSTIYKLFTTYGEDKFRKLERDTIRSLSNENKIIATGGGTPCYLNNMEWIKNNGISIYLNLNHKSLFHRLKNAKENRPLIKDLDNNQLSHYIITNLNKRKKYYSQADITIEVINLDIKEIQSQILDYCK